MVQIKINIPAEYLNDLIAGILKAAPKPRIHSHLSDKEYIKAWLKDMILDTYRVGKQQIASETTKPTYNDVITSVE